MPAKDTTENQVTADQAITKEIQGTVKKIVGDSKTEAPNTEAPKTDIPKKSFLKGLFSCCSRDVAQEVKLTSTDKNVKVEKDNKNANSNKDGENKPKAGGLETETENTEVVIDALTNTKGETAPVEGAKK